MKQELQLSQGFFHAAIGPTPNAKYWLNFSQFQKKKSQSGGVFEIKKRILTAHIIAHQTLRAVTEQQITKNTK